MERTTDFWWHRLCSRLINFCLNTGNNKMMLDLSIKAFLVDNILCIKNRGWFINIDKLIIETVSDEKINNLILLPHEIIMIPYDYIFMINHHRNNPVVVERSLKEIKMVIDQHRLNQQNASSCL